MSVSHLGLPWTPELSWRGKNLPEEVQEQVATSVFQWLPWTCRITLMYLLGCLWVFSIPEPCSSLLSLILSLQPAADPGLAVPQRHRPGCFWSGHMGISWNVIHFPPTYVHLTSPSPSFKNLFSITYSMREPFLNLHLTVPAPSSAYVTAGTDLD